MKFIKPEIEFVKYESNDIIATSIESVGGIFYADNTFISGELMKKLEKSFNTGRTAQAAFVDFVDFDSKSVKSIEEDYYKIFSVYYDGKLYPSGVNRDIPLYTIKLESTTPYVKFPKDYTSLYQEQGNSNVNIYAWLSSLNFNQ